jgi:hypothetical protein
METTMENRANNSGATNGQLKTGQAKPGLAQTTVPCHKSFLKLKHLLFTAAILFAPLAAATPPADDSSRVASDLVQLGALFESTNRTPLEQIVLAAPESCPTRFALTALQYRTNPDAYRNTFFEQLVIDDYAQRAKGLYNIVSPTDVEVAVDRAEAEYPGIADRRWQLVVAFCSLKDKNLWVESPTGRISAARVIRGAALHAVLQGTDENPLEIANAVDAHTARHQTAPEVR